MNKLSLVHSMSTFAPRQHKECSSPLGFLASQTKPTAANPVVQIEISVLLIRFQK